ncbi:winged helix DNA-binding domain-containing protein [Nocardioides anomalus]|uniref:Winged helix DNA-binding domain-containing protein n=1 Tax=Nocardioides anomalus TaxID=2712223 RepID=A0A6G6W915_9ACTN|nr:winged helix DNA-binding domain-containing protein [Nocardioides anomalus]QIG41595.1 winged helix DNA-binding domain-containing protein [Nocardioides anomalus]
MTAVGFAAANARRLARHGLTAPLGSLAAAAAAVAGVHAQIMSAAEVSLGLRVSGVTRSDVAAALWEERSLVKTFGPRGTVHLLAAEDLAWWLPALAAVPPAGGHPDGVRLTPEETDAVVAALDATLREGDRTTEELDAHVGEACGAWAAEESMAAFGGFWPRWRQALGVAASRGVLCSGPNRGRRVTYASPSRWVGELAPVPADEAELRLLRAYLTAYGPATPDHLARWLATTPAWTRALFARAELDEVALEGEPAWVWRGDDGFDAPEPPGVLLLPYFDAFQVGSRPRGLLFPGRAAERALAGSQAGNFPVLLLDGVVGGVWHQKRSGRRVTITVEPLGRLSAAQRRALDDEVKRVGTVVEARPELVVGPVTVGAHA